MKKLTVYFYIYFLFLFNIQSILGYYFKFSISYQISSLILSCKQKKNCLETNSNTLMPELEVLGNANFNGNVFLNNISYPGSGILGNLVIGQDNKIYRTGSSEEYKTNINKLDDDKYLNIIDKINIYSFQYKKDPSEHTYIGCMAEELINISPEFVLTDENKNPVNIDYQSLCMILFKIVQEQKKDIDEIKAILNKLLKQ